MPLDVDIFQSLHQFQLNKEGALVIAPDSDHQMPSFPDNALTSNSHPNSYPSSSSNASSSGNSTLSNYRLGPGLHPNGDLHWTNTLTAAASAEGDSQGSSLLPQSIHRPGSLYIDHGSPSYCPSVETIGNLGRNWGDNGVGRDVLAARFATSDSQTDHLADRARTPFQPGLSIPSIYQYSVLPSGVPPMTVVDYRQCIRAPVTLDAARNQYNGYGSQGRYQERSHRFDQGSRHLEVTTPDLSGNSRNKNAPASLAPNRDTLPPPPPLTSAPLTSFVTSMAPCTSKPRTTKPNVPLLPTPSQPTSEGDSSTQATSSETIHVSQSEPAEGSKKHACWMCHKSFDRPRYALA